MKMNSTTIFALCCGICALVTSGLAGVVRQPSIDNPCRVDPTSTARDFLNLTGQLSLTIYSANSVIPQCLAAQNCSVTSNLLTQADVDSSTNFTITGLPLRLDVPTVSEATMTDTLEAIYEDLSIYIVHIQKAKEQQMNDFQRMVPEIKEVEDGLFILLCQADTLLKTKGVHMSQFVTSSVIDPSFMTNSLDNKFRYQRNFVLMENARLYLSNLVLIYQQMIDFLG